MENELTCCVCLDLFTEPLMLPCSHNFCKKCLWDLFHHSRAVNAEDHGPRPRQITCPKCRREVQWDPFSVNGTDHLPLNKALDNIVRVYKSTYRPVSKANFKKCLKHTKELALYCQTCKRSLCEDCVLQAHSGFGHLVKEIEDFIQEEKDKAKSSIQEIESLKTELLAKDTEVTSMIVNSKAREMEMRKAVEHQFEMIKSCISSQQTKTLNDLTGQLSKSREHLQRLSGTYTALRTDIQYLRNNYKHALQECDPERQLKLLQGLTLRLSTFLTFRSNGLPNLPSPVSEQNGHVNKLQDALDIIKHLHWVDTSTGKSSGMRDTRDHSTQTLDGGTGSGMGESTESCKKILFSKSTQINCTQIDLPSILPNDSDVSGFYKSINSLRLEVPSINPLRDSAELDMGHVPKKAKTPTLDGENFTETLETNLEQLNLDSTHHWRPARPRSAGSNFSSHSEEHLKIDFASSWPNSKNKFSSFTNNAQTVEDTPFKMANKFEAIPLPCPKNLDAQQNTNPTGTVPHHCPKHSHGVELQPKTDNSPQAACEEASNHPSNGEIQNGNGPVEAMGLNGFHLQKGIFGVREGKVDKPANQKPVSSDHTYPKGNTLKFYFGGSDSASQPKLIDVFPAPTTSLASGSTKQPNVNGNSFFNSQSQDTKMKVNGSETAAVGTSSKLSGAPEPAPAPVSVSILNSTTSESMGSASRETSGSPVFIVPTAEVAQSQCCGIGARPKVRADMSNKPRNLHKSRSVASADGRDDKKVGSTLKDGFNSAVCTIKSLCRTSFSAGNSREPGLDLNANDNGAAGALSRRPIHDGRSIGNGTEREFLRMTSAPAVLTEDTDMTNNKRHKNKVDISTSPITIEKLKSECSVWTSFSFKDISNPNPFSVPSNEKNPFEKSESPKPGWKSCTFPPVPDFGPNQSTSEQKVGKVDFSQYWTTARQAGANSSTDGAAARSGSPFKVLNHSATLMTPSSFSFPNRPFDFVGPSGPSRPKLTTLSSPKLKQRKYRKAKKHQNKRNLEN